MKLRAAKNAFEKNFKDVENLFSIHGNITKGVRGQGRNLTPSLLRSIVITLSACWEAYVEDVCLEGAKLVRTLNDPSKLPNGIKSKIVTPLKSNPNPIEIFNLAGGGWRKLYDEQVRNLCDGLAGGLNTPNSKNVTQLLETIFGLKRVHEQWSWSGMNPANAAKKLDELVVLRGSIAHGRAQPGLSAGDCWRYSNHVEKLVEKTNDAVERQVKVLIA